MKAIKTKDESAAPAARGRRRRTAKLDGPHPIDVHVGARIRHRRAVVGLNQTELALKVGVTFQSIQKYERGANRVSASRLQEIAGVLGVPVSHFFEGLSDGVPDPEAATPERLLTSQEIRELNSAFAAIADKAVRQAVLHLLKSVAGRTQVDPAALLLLLTR
jgi:transcriptional regulator with XRE-family HTH domain